MMHVCKRCDSIRVCRVIGHEPSMVGEGKGQASAGCELNGENNVAQQGWQLVGRGKAINRLQARCAGMGSLPLCNART
jgi:hypothetical protein